MKKQNDTMIKDYKKQSQDSERIKIKENRRDP